ncbi:MAG: hypothetical protein KGQ37_02590 [Hyphomicrobiales bacterium]|nr:hypothetical protein [Hyphomicrobiales bacterium]
MGRASAKWVAFWVAAGLFAAISALGTWGFARSCGYPGSSAAAITDALYRTLQLYLLNYTPYECHGAAAFHINAPLQAARFLAPTFATGTVILSLVEPLRDYVRLFWQSSQARRRVIVIGYGAPGEAMARHLAQTELVTVITREPDSRGRQRPVLGRLLVTDGHDDLQAALRRVRADKAQRLFITGASDMQALDGAHVTQAWLARRHKRKADLRVILLDPALAREMIDISASGGGLWHELAAFTLPQMAAEGLVQVARFDRTALEAGQAGVHVVLFGASSQGEAIITEILLTAWRVALQPPRLDIFAGATNALEARLHGLAPALFADAGAPGLPTGSAPQIVFHNVDAAQWNASAALSPLQALQTPVTAYVFADDDDTANFRAAMELESAMLQERLAAAPIYIYLGNAHQGAAADPGFSATSLIRPFGALDALVARGIAFERALDGQARQLHHAYLRSGMTMQKIAQEQGETFRFSALAWDELPETLRVSNRRLFRHSVQKLEDFGLQWPLQGLHLPAVTGADHARLVDSALLDSVAVREHDRWMCERALEGWMPGEARDDQRRLHPSIRRWDELDAPTRNYDRVFARSLLEPQTDRLAARPQARMRHLAGLVLLPQHKPDGEISWQAHTTLVAGEPAASELVIGIRWPPAAAGRTRLGPAGMAAGIAEVQHLLRSERRLQALCRMRFVHARPPEEVVLRMIERIVSEAAPQDCEISVQWLWGRGAPPPLASAIASPDALWQSLGLMPGGARPLVQGS